MRRDATGTAGWPHSERRLNMIFELDKVRWISVLMGLLLYVVVLGWIWLLSPRRRRQDNSEAYHAWRALQDDPHASFQEYFNSEEGPRSPLSLWDKTWLTTAVAALVLVLALQRWGALHDL